jgi:predicted XRE-type DNA-binding protein
MSRAFNTKGTDNVFQNLGFEPQEAQNLLLRAQAWAAIIQWHRKSGLTQAQAAKMLGMTQPRLNQLLKGKLTEFSLDALVNITAAAGMKITFTVSAPKKPKKSVAPKTRPRRLKTAA